jgi:Ankyrin repeats (3 copies)/Ankyrin repeat
VRSSVSSQANSASHDSMLMALIRAIAARDTPGALRLIEGSPELARQAVVTGASRQVSTDYYFKEIEHYVYGGDTALHIAAAAYALDISKVLLAGGANVRARNRRGAEPLHYAVDGIPESPCWNPAAQEVVVEFLIRAGADPNSADKSGVTPLHRAVRTRCASAVRALLLNGAKPRARNGSGSTPLHLAVQNTGRGGSGSPASREQQWEIIVLLLSHGARPTDKDISGKTVVQSVREDWVLEILGTHPSPEGRGWPEGPGEG